MKTHLPGLHPQEVKSEGLNIRAGSKGPDGTLPMSLLSKDSANMDGDNLKSMHLYQSAALSSCSLNTM